MNCARCAFSASHGKVRAKRAEMNSEEMKVYAYREAEALIFCPIELVLYELWRQIRNIIGLGSKACISSITPSSMALPERLLLYRYEYFCYPLQRCLICTERSKRSNV